MANFRALWASGDRTGVVGAETPPGAESCGIWGVAGDIWVAGGVILAPDGAANDCGVAGVDDLI